MVSALTSVFVCNYILLSASFSLTYEWLTSRLLPEIHDGNHDSVHWCAYASLFHEFAMYPYHMFRDCSRKSRSGKTLPWQVFFISGMFTRSYHSLLRMQMYSRSQKLVNPKRVTDYICCYKNAMTCKKDVKRKSKHTLSCNDPFKWHHYWTVLGYVRMVEGWSLIAFRSHLSSHSSSWESCGERTVDKHPKAKQEISLTRQTVKKTAEFAVRHASRIFDDYDLKGYSQEVS